MASLQVIGGGLFFYLHFYTKLNISLVKNIMIIHDLVKCLVGRT